MADTAQKKIGLEKRIKSLRIAAEDGDAESLYLLGVAYAQGKGVTRCDSTASRMFLKASRAGHVRAGTSLGYMHSKGRGARHDLVLAYIFLRHGADNGDPLARDLITVLGKRMTEAQVREADLRYQRRGIQNY